jgi:DNA-binding GntR family transcriptional regulator
MRKNVAEVLRNSLFDGHFPPGTELSDSALAAEFQVSRGPVREALLILSEEGMIEHRHHRGFFVPRLEVRDLQQISRTRRPLETLALELAKENATSGHLKDLRALKKDLVNAFRKDGIGGCARPDFAFHSRIWQMARDSWLDAALRRISIPYFAYVAAFHLQRREHTAKIMDEMHERYIAYLAGDIPDSAADCVAFHLRMTE